MIRINLLPSEERVSSRKVALPRMGALAPFAVLPLVLGVVGVSAGLERAKLTTLRTDVAEVREEVRALQPQVDRVKKLTAKREELERRLEVIHQLDKERFASVRLMDELARQVPSYMWLTQVHQVSPDRVMVGGVTFSNLIVADLMMRMERANLFGGVDLTQTERGLIDEREVIQFAITSRITPEGEADAFTADVAPTDEEE